MMGLYMADDFANSVGITDTGMGTESGEPNADTTETTAYGIHAIRKPAQINMATCKMTTMMSHHCSVLAVYCYAVGRKQGEKQHKEYRHTMHYHIEKKTKSV